LVQSYFSPYTVIGGIRPKCIVGKDGNQQR